MATTKEEEQHLIKAIALGDKESFRLVVLEHQNMIFRVIMKQVGNRIIAEELAQEVFVKAYFNIKQFRGDAKLITWLTRIALNVTNNYFNSRRYKEHTLSDTFDSNQHDHHYDLATIEHDEEQIRNQATFLNALRKLSSPYRETITLCGLEGKSYEEAATILDVPVGTIRSRLNKARLLLQELISSDEVHHE